MSAPRRFESRFRVAAPPEAVRALHEDPRVLRALTPAPLRFLEPPTAQRVRFRLWMGPVPVTWHARHEAAREEGFVDVMERGPFRAWRHEHRFLPAPGGGTQVVDVIEAEPLPGPRGWMGRALWAGLRPAFAYRAWRTRRLLRRASGRRTQG